MPSAANGLALGINAPRRQGPLGTESPSRDRPSIGQVARSLGPRLSARSPAGA